MNILLCFENMAWTRYPNLCVDRGATFLGGDFVGIGVTLLGNVGGEYFGRGICEATCQIELLGMLGE